MDLNDIEKSKYHLGKHLKWCNVKTYPKDDVEICNIKLLQAEFDLCLVPRNIVKGKQTDGWKDRITLRISNKMNIADVCPYVAACARTRTPPAQRLGRHGESDAISSPVCFNLKRYKNHILLWRQHRNKTNHLFALELTCRAPNVSLCHANRRTCERQVEVIFARLYISDSAS